MDDKTFDKKQAIQGVFSRAASSYGEIRYFPVLGQWLVEMAQISDGVRVLDVASGRGAVLFPAVQKVGTRGWVVGIDLAEGMVDETAANIFRFNLTQARILRMDAEQLDFPDACFDYVLCGFALQFFPNLDRTLAEFRRVLKPGGKIAVTTWGEDDPRWSWYDDLRAKYQVAVKLSSQSLDKREELFARFCQAGFTNIQVHTKELETVFADEEEWWQVQWSVSGRAGLERMQPKLLKKFLIEASQQLQTIKQPDGFHENLEAHCTLAFKPLR